MGLTPAGQSVFFLGRLDFQHSGCPESRTKHISRVGAVECSCNVVVILAVGVMNHGPMTTECRNQELTS